MTAQEKVQNLVETLNADFFGVSDLAPAYDAILEQGGPAIAKFPYAISIGIALMHAVVDQLPQRLTEPASAMNYRYHGYTLVNQRLDHIASRVSSVLQQAGYRALPIPASQTVDEARQRGAFSHKLAAHLAGLGWIGRNCLLITPEVGPRVRWATVLTDAPLTPTGMPMDQRCGNCHQCVDICPVQAFTGEPYRDGEPREVRFDVHKCEAYFDHMADIGVNVCGMCLYVCPYGKSASR